MKRPPMNPISLFAALVILLGLASALPTSLKKLHHSQPALRRRLERFMVQYWH